MHVWMYACMNGWMHGWIDRSLDAWMHGCMDACMYAWMHGCMDAWMHGCMDAWMHGNETIRMTTEAGDLSKKVDVRTRRDDECAGKTMVALQADGDRRRGRPKWRWMDNIKGDLKQNGLTREDEEEEEDWSIRLVTLIVMVT